ncbi:leucine-rich repeat-containing protein 46 [Candoia aspera]|uniref:leucine-rich repeat-containing protein 46 n=1 Tax=Candoia aspera TaxID=51853 RepID=UPI002FD8709D
MPGANLQRSPTGGVCLTKSLIVQRNVTMLVEKEDPEKISEALTSLQVLRLDRERISCIADLPDLKQVHSIYLQQNQIEKIENLSCFPNLKFLSLAGNYISRVENLQSLLKLKFLDLSQNCIDILDIDELPLNLAVLDLTGNKCMNQKGYRESVLAALPHLIELDNKGISNQKATVQNNEEENSSEESDCEDCPELSQPLSTEKDFFVNLHNEFTSRSAWRREIAMREHEARLEELRQRQNLRQLVFNTNEGRPEALSTPESRSPVLNNNLPQNEHQTALNSLQRTVNPALDAGLNTPKGKNEGTTQTQLKISKGEISSAAKTAKNNIKK